MKKLLGSTLALALMFSGMGQANAELLKNFKLGGQIDVQATSARNVTDFATRANPVGGANNDRIGDAQTRIMLHMDWDLLDDVHAKVTLRKNDRNYGTAGGGNANTNANSQALTSAGGTGVIESLRVDQANFKIDKLGGSVDATFGRQFYGNSGDMVLYYGPSDKALYGLPTTSIDAVRFDWGTENMGVTALVGKTTGHAVGAATTADVDVRGIAVMCKQHEAGTTGIYLWNRVTHNVGALGAPPTSGGSAGGKNDNLYVVGAKAKLKSDSAWLGAEIAKNFGDNRVAGSATASPAATYSGWALKVDAGMKADMGMAALSPWLHFGYGKGDTRTRDNKNEAFTAISPDYRPGSIYGRFAVAAGGASLASGSSALVASNSLSNRIIWGAGVKATPSGSKLTAGVSYYDYKLQAYQTAPDASAANGGNRHIGSEIDLDFTWAHSENVTLGAGVGSFQPGGLIKEANKAASAQQPVNPATMGYMDVRVRF